MVANNLLSYAPSVTLPLTGMELDSNIKFSAFPFIFVFEISITPAQSKILVSIWLIRTIN